MLKCRGGCLFYTKQMCNFIKQLTGAHVIRKYTLKIIELLHWAWSINVILFVPPQCDENHSPSSPYESSNARVIAALLAGHQECAQSRNVDIVSSQRMHYSCMNAKHESRSKFTVFFTANYTNTKVKKNRSTLGVLNYFVTAPAAPKSLTYKCFVGYIKIIYMYVFHFLSQYNHNQRLNVHVSCQFSPCCVHLWSSPTCLTNPTQKTGPDTQSDSI